MSIEKNLFGKMPNGRSVECYTLKNSLGMSADIIPFGCRIVRLFTADKNGHFDDVILGHDDLESYLNPTDYHGAIVGRYANRIANAELTIDGISYSLTANEGKNILHGGNGFSHKLWDVIAIKDDHEPSITMEYISKDGEEGFPGNLTVHVTYALTEKNGIKIDYSAKTDIETAVNFTNHAYFTISGNANDDVLNQQLQINADSYTEADSTLIPTGKFVPVAGTPFDFRATKPIGQDIHADEALLRQCGGYDHNFVLNGDGLRKAAELYDSKSGRVMEVFTDVPGMQLYTANGFSANSMSKNGIKMQAHHAVCLETQFFPDSVHHSNFPSAFLKPNQQYNHTTIYQFSVK